MSRSADGIRDAMSNSFPNKNPWLEHFSMSVRCCIASHRLSASQALLPCWHKKLDRGLNWSVIITIFTERNERIGGPCLVNAGRAMQMPCVRMIFERHWDDRRWAASTATFQYFNYSYRWLQMTWTMAALSTASSPSEPTAHFIWMWLHTIDGGRAYGAGMRAVFGGNFVAAISCTWGRPVFVLVKFPEIKELDHVQIVIGNLSRT